MQVVPESTLPPVGTFSPWEAVRVRVRKRLLGEFTTNIAASQIAEGERFIEWAAREGLVPSTVTKENIEALVL